MSEYFVGSTGVNNQTNFSSLSTSEVLDDLSLNTSDSPTFAGLDIESSTPALSITDSDSNVPYELRVDSSTFSIKEVTNSRTLMSMTAGAVITLDSLGSNTILNTSASVVVPNGKIGIGTTSPANLLHLDSNNNVGPTIELQNSQYSSYINAWGSSAASGRTSRFEINASTTDFAVAGDSIRFQIGDVGDAHEKMRIDSAGNVGIGTTSPSYKLDVDGTTSTDRLIVNQAVNGTNDLLIKSAGGTYTHSLGADTSGYTFKISTIHSTTLDMGSGSSKFYLNMGGSNSWQIGSDFIAPASAGAGSVGHINAGHGGYFGFYTIGSTASMPVFYLNDRTANDTYGFKLITKNGGTVNNTIVADNDGNVGIGTTNPTSILDIRDTQTGAASEIKLFNLDQGNTTTQTSALVMSPDLRANGVKIVAVKENADFSSAANKDVAITFSPVLNNAAVEKMRITSAGNVGIGETNPLRGNLVVKGDFQTIASGNGQLAVISKVSGSDPAAKDIGGQMVFGGPISSSDSRRTFGLVGGYKENNTSGDRAGYLTFGTRQNTGSQDIFERMRITSAGNVGIGTTTPENKLHILTSTTDTSSQLMVQNGSSGDAAIKFNISGQSYVIGIDNSDANKFKISGHASLGTYDRLTIDTSGNATFAGKVTSSTTVSNDAAATLTTKGYVDAAVAGGVSGSFLELAGGTMSGAIAMDSNNITGGGSFFANLFSVGNEGKVVSTSTLGLQLQSTGSQKPIIFSTNDGGMTERMRVHTDGNVGIGTSSPAGILEVAGNTDTDSNFLVIRDKDPTAGSARPSIRFAKSDGTVLGQLLALDGTNQRLQFSGNNTQDPHLTVYNNGNVGIGTTSPSFTSGSGLQITHATQANLRLSDSTDASYNTDVAMSNDDFFLVNRSATGHLKFRVNNTTEAITVLQDGNVGIGTTSPVAKLDVSTTGADGINLSKDTGTTNISTRLFFSNATAGQGVSIYNSSANMMFQTGSTAGSTTGNTRMVINSAGRVGIGTTAPSSLLHLEAAVSPALQIKDTTNNVTFKAYAQDSNSHLGNTSNHDLFIDTNNVSRITVKADGKVGIGTTSPTEKLEVSGRIKSSDGLLSNGHNLYAGSATTGFLIELDVASNNYAHIHGALKLQQFNVSSQQIINFSATTLNTGTVQSSAATADIDVTIKLFVYNSKWYIHVPSPSTYTDISAYVHLGAGYQGSSRASNCIISVTSAAVPSSGVSGSVDIIAQKRVLANTSGNVGIGTTNPATSLHVFDSAGPTIRFERSNNSKLDFTFGSTNTSIIGAGELQFRANGGTSNKFVINNSLITANAVLYASANVGIGTTSPALQSGGTGLHINAASNSELKFTNNTTGATASDGTALVSNGNNFTINNREAGTLSLGTNNQVRLSINSSGTATFAGNVNIAQANNLTAGSVITTSSTALTAVDNGKAFFGNGLDLQIYHDGSDSYIKDVGTGELRISGSATRIYDADMSSLQAEFKDGGSVDLYYDSNKKFETNITGVAVTGGVDIKVGSAINGTITSSSNSLTLNARNTGIMLFQSGGSEKMRINSSGNVGIGATSPAYRLHVAGTVGLTSSLYFTNNTAHIQVGSTWNTGVLNFLNGSTTAIQFDIPNGRIKNNLGKYLTAASTIGQFGTLDNQSVAIVANNSEKMRITSAGNVGIGILAPTFKLHVKSDDSNDDIAYIHHDNPSQSSGTVLKVRSDAGDSSGYSLLDVSNNTGNALYVRGDRKVGIGTTSPARKLHIKNDGQIKLENTGTGGWAGLDILTSSGTNNYDMYMGMTDNDGRFFIDVNSNGDDLVILQNGNVGIGTTGPTAKTHVYGGSSGATVSTNSNLLAIESNGNNGLQFLNPSANNANINFGDPSNNEIGFIQYQHATDAMRFRAGGTTILNLVGGNVGIGNTNPTAAKLIVRQDSGYAFRTENASGYTFRIAGDTGNIEAAGDLTVSGDLTVNGTTSTINSTTLQVDDKNIELGTVATPTDTTADGGGITLKGATDKTINWINSTDAWTFNKKVSVPSIIANLSSEGTYFTGGSGGLRQLSITSGTNTSAHALHTFNIASSNGKYEFDVDGTTELSLDSSSATFAGAVTIANLSVSQTAPTTQLLFDNNNIDNGGGYNIDFKSSSNDTANRFMARIQALRGSGAISSLGFFTETGSALTRALLLDSSQNATFGGDINLGTGKSLYMSGANGLRFLHDGSNGNFINGTGDFKVTNGAVDKDIIFRGNDGGSSFTALTLDMSAGGNATFAKDLTARVGSFKSIDASASTLMNLMCNDGSNAASFRTTVSGRVFEIRSQNSGTLKFDSTSSTFTGAVTVGGHILPSTSLSYDLGSDSKRFASVFCHGFSATSSVTTPTIQLQGNLKILNKAQSAYLDLAVRNTTDTEVKYDLNNVGSLNFPSGTLLKTDSGNQYLKLQYASTGAGGIKVCDGDNALQGYLYADGSSTPSFGLLHGGGSWAVLCRKNSYVQIRHGSLNATKFQTQDWGLSFTGNTVASGNVYAGGANGFVFGSSTSEGEYIYRTGNDIRVFAGGDDRLAVDGDAGNVGINANTPTYKLDVNGGIRAGGKVTYEKSAGSLDTTGYAVAGLVAGSNGMSAGFTFTSFGHTGSYQKIVYSCHNASGTWNTQKVIDEGTNDFDVTASANGSTITFTFKSRSGTKSYTPRVSVEAFGSSINNTYA